MQNIKSNLQTIRLTLSDSVINGENLGQSEARSIFNSIKEIEKEIDRLEQQKELFTPPVLPMGDKYNPYPRFLLIVLKEYDDRDESFSFGDLIQKTGASRNQLRIDLDRLEEDGFITCFEYRIGERRKSMRYKVV